MPGAKIIGIILVIAGILGLVYERFTFTRDTDDISLGPIELEVKERETVQVPTWAGVGAIVLGGVLLLGTGRKRLF